MRGERYGTARAARIAHGLAGALTVLAGAAAGAVHARDQSREDAWWTGPMLAPSAATLPSGHMLIEPYLFDVMSDGRFDANGTRQSAPGEHDIGSFTYMLYGVTDRVTVGMIPRFVFNEPAGAANSSHPGVGDLTLQAGFGVTRFEDGHRTPAIAVVLDVVDEHQGDTLGRGEVAPPAGGSGGGRFSADSASLYALQLAPAIEYNFSSRIGVLLGVRLFAAGRNTTSSVTPALALNMVY